MPEEEITSETWLDELTKETERLGLYQSSHVSFDPKYLKTVAKVIAPDLEAIVRKWLSSSDTKSVSRADMRKVLEMSAAYVEIGKYDEIENSEHKNEA